MILLMVFFFLTRLPNLLILPIFADEAIYIRWAQLINSGQIFIPLTDGKTPLFMWLLAPLLYLGFDPLITGRMLSVFSGLSLMLGVYFFTQVIFNRKIAILSSILVIFQPFILFYDRLSLTDSLLTSLIVWSAYFLLKNHWALNLTSVSAFLVKPSAISFLLALGCLLIIKPQNWKKLGLAGLLTVLVYNLFRLSDSFRLISQRSSDYLRPLSLSNFSQTALTLFNWLISYFHWPFFLIFFVVVVLAIKNKNRKILSLLLFILIPFCLQAAIGKILYPRYLLPLAPFLLIIFSWGIRQFKFGLILILLFFLSWLKFDFLILTDPIKAPFHPAEKEQYLTSWASGRGLKEIKAYLMNLPKDQKIVVATEGSFGTLPNGLQIYFPNDSNIQILGVGFPKTTVSPEMEKALAQGKFLYLVANRNRYNLSELNRLKLISEYSRPGGETLVFYAVY